MPGFTEGIPVMAEGFPASCPAQTIVRSHN